MVEAGELVGVLLALGLGFLVAWLIRRPQEHQVPEFEGIFSRLSAEALAANNEQFLALAEQALKVQQAEGNKDL